MNSSWENWIKCPFNRIVGLTFKSVEAFVDGCEDHILFETDCGLKFKMYHFQSCCEDVRIEDICGDLQDLVGSPVLVAEEVFNDASELIKGPIYQCTKSATWTFYKIDTRKGGVTIRWYRTSNGFYSERADFAILLN